jgi:hypothetical protein
MAYLQKGKPAKPGGCESCGPSCGCHSCRAKLPSGGMAGFGERYERDEEAEPAVPPGASAGSRAAGSPSVAGWGFAFAAPPRRRLVRRRAPGPSVRQLQEEIFRLRQQLRAAMMGPISRSVRRDQPLPDAPAPESPLPDAAPGATPHDAAPPDVSPADTPPPEGGTSGWYGDSPPLPDIVRVRGFRVARALAPRLAALLSAAEADGITLRGSGYRSRDRQIELRQRHCGPTHFDIWERPSSQCRPPTATPGRSMHERGLAIDFTQHGRALTRESPGFRWLMQNAARFGFKNLPSEPWHWSVNGR